MSRELRRKRKIRKMCRRFVRLLLASAVVMVLVFAMKKRTKEVLPAQENQIRLLEEKVNGTAAAEPDTEGKNTTNAGGERDTEEETACRRLYENNQELCVLVNKEVELPSDFDPALRSICGGRLMASEWMYQDLTEMLHAAETEGYTYWVASAYRSRRRQEELVEEDVKKLMEQGKSREDALAETLKETMPPGHSEHETGLALDILSAGNTSMDVSQAQEAANQWLVAHCSEYGFILRYPKDKASVTGIAWEPWHFRYVGKEAARYMTEHGMTLEEFCRSAGVQD